MKIVTIIQLPNDIMVANKNIPLAISKIIIIHFVSLYVSFAFVVWFL